jgi:hypothetical protein
MKSQYIYIFIYLFIFLTSIFIEEISQNRLWTKQALKSNSRSFLNKRPTPAKIWTFKGCFLIKRELLLRAKFMTYKPRFF